MSTADSALLSISSMFTKDIYHAYLRPRSSQAELTLVGKLCSWAIVAILVIIAIGTDKTLIRLLELKFRGADSSRALLLPRTLLAGA